MNYSKFKHKTPVQVRFADIDKMGHVNNAIFLSYFETARIKYFDEVVGERIDWTVKGMILAKSIVDYKKPIFQNDTLQVYSSVTKIGNKSFEISGVIVKIKNGKEEIAASSVITLVCFDYQKSETIIIPDDWKKQLLTYESYNE